MKSGLKCTEISSQYFMFYWVLRSLPRLGIKLGWCITNRTTSKVTLHRTKVMSERKVDALKVKPFYVVVFLKAAFVKNRSKCLTAAESPKTTHNFGTIRPSLLYIPLKMLSRLHQDRNSPSDKALSPFTSVFTCTEYFIYLLFWPPIIVSRKIFQLFTSVSVPCIFVGVLTRSVWSPVPPPKDAGGFRNLEPRLDGWNAREESAEIFGWRIYANLCEFEDDDGSLELARRWFRKWRFEFWDDFRQQP